MKNQFIATALVCALTGFGIGYVASSPEAPQGKANIPVSGKTHRMADGTLMSNDGMNMSGGGMQSAMDGMMAQLEGKTGDEFDKAFLTEMMMHHEGAVDMAKAALKDAKRTEIKDMANAIITAQTKEIEMMRQWQAQWYQ